MKKSTTGKLKDVYRHSFGKEPEKLALQGLKKWYKSLRSNIKRRGEISLFKEVKKHG